MNRRALSIRTVLLPSALALLVAPLAPSCAKKDPDRGGLMLEVTSDGSPIDRVDIEITTSDRTLFANSYSVPDEAQLPTTVALVSNGIETTVVNIAVIGWRAGQPIDRRVPRLQFVNEDRAGPRHVFDLEQTGLRYFNQEHGAVFSFSCRSHRQAGFKETIIKTARLVAELNIEFWLLLFHKRVRRTWRLKRNIGYIKFLYCKNWLL